MQQYSPSGNQPSRRQLRQRLDRIFGELNVYLAAFAIGLAVLDLTCLYGVTVGKPVMEAFHRGATPRLAWPGLAPTAQRPSDDSSD